MLLGGGALAQLSGERSGGVGHRGDDEHGDLVGLGHRELRPRPRALLRITPRGGLCARRHESADLCDLDLIRRLVSENARAHAGEQGETRRTAERCDLRGRGERRAGAERALERAPHRGEPHAGNELGERLGVGAIPA